MRYLQRSFGVLIVMVGFAGMAWSHGGGVQRKGLTMEGGWGIGYTATLSGAGAPEGGVDATSVGFGLGLFLTEDLAVLARVGPGHGYSLIGERRIERVTQTPLAGVIQYFPHPRWMVAGGGAWMIRAQDTLTETTATTVLTHGWGVVLRAGHGFANFRTFGMRLVVSVILSGYGGETLVASDLGFEVQSF